MWAWLVRREIVDYPRSCCFIAKDNQNVDESVKLVKCLYGLFLKRVMYVGFQ